MTPSIECVVEVRSVNGEGALWSAAEQALYWVDLPLNHLHRYDPSSGDNKTWILPEQPGCVAESTGGDLVVALANGFCLFDRESGEVQLIGGPDAKSLGHRFSEGIVDPSGRFLAGTSPYDGPTESDNSGTVYAFGNGDTGRVVLGGFHTINGMAFSPDGKTAYASDSFPSVRRIWSWDYDVQHGDWRNKKLFFDTKGLPGRPDGAAMDTNGCYWMAAVSGWQLMRLTPNGKIDLVIDLPVEKPSRPAFGGKDLQTLYFTSLNHTLSNEEDQPKAGGVFALKVPGIQGLEPSLMQLEPEEPLQAKINPGQSLHQSHSR